jgi:hypothetical protein
VSLLELRRGQGSLEDVRRVILMCRVHLLHRVVPYFRGRHVLAGHMLLVLLMVLLVLVLVVVL